MAKMAFSLEEALCGSTGLLHFFVTMQEEYFSSPSIVTCLFERSRCCPQTDSGEILRGLGAVLQKHFKQPPRRASASDRS